MFLPSISDRQNAQRLQILVYCSFASYLENYHYTTDDFNSISFTLRAKYFLCRTLLLFLSSCQVFRISQIQISARGQSITTTASVVFFSPSRQRPWPFQVTTYRIKLCSPPHHIHAISSYQLTVHSRAVSVLIRVWINRQLGWNTIGVYSFYVGL